MLDRFFRSTSSKLAYYVITYGLYAAIAGSFDVAFTLRITGSFVSLTFLYLLYYASLTVVFTVSTMFVAHGRFSRGFRLAFAMQIFLGFLMFFLLPSPERPYVLIPYFICRGFAEGFFWSSRHGAMSCLTENDRRDRFLIALQVGSVAVSVTMPFLSGIFMHFNSVRSGYSGIYLAAAFVSLACLALGPHIVTAPIPRPDLRKFKSFLTAKNTAALRNYNVFSTVNVSLVVMCTGVLNFGVLKTEFNLGMYVSAAAVLSAVFLLFIRKKITGQRVSRMKFVLIGESGDILGRAVFVVLLSVPSLVFKAFCDNFLSPLRSIFTENIIRKRADILSAEEGYTSLEPFLFQEITLLLARIVTFSFCALVFFCNPVAPVTAARIILGVLAFAPFLDAFFISRIERENLHKMT